MRGESPVRLGSRARHILLILLENAGTVVTKKELLASTWENTVVEEGALRVHMTHLRKSLGDHRHGARYIESVAGLGYRFAANIRVVGFDASTGEAAEPGIPDVFRPVGRDAVIGAIIRRLRSGGFMTIVGSPGVGKSVTAAAIANDLRPNYPDGTSFIDVASFDEPEHIYGVIATGLGIAGESSDIVTDIVACLQTQRRLFVFDNAEHAPGLIARVAEEMIEKSSWTAVLATSREPLRARNEQLCRLGPLDIPDYTAGLSASAALSFFSVQLFVERAVASSYEFAITDSNAPVVAEICRNVDGLPLAIELAAACLDTLSLSDLLQALKDLPNVLTRGRRTSPSRHQTLLNAFEQSFASLSRLQYVALSRLATIEGTFDLSAACVALGSESIEPAVVLELVTDLAARSLVTTGVVNGKTTFRLLNACRLCVLQQHADNGGYDKSHQNLIIRADKPWPPEQSGELQFQRRAGSRQ